MFAYSLVESPQIYAPDPVDQDKIDIEVSSASTQRNNPIMVSLPGAGSQSLELPPEVLKFLVQQNQGNQTPEVRDFLAKITANIKKIDHSGHQEIVIHDLKKEFTQSIVIRHNASSIVLPKQIEEDKHEENKQIDNSQNAQRIVNNMGKYMSSWVKNTVNEKK